jgi:AraC-like DNA-binding protein
MDHVTRNLDGSLHLDEIARAAGFAPFHFHRVFKCPTGETLGPFVKRQPLERALYDFSCSFKQRFDGWLPSRLIPHRHHSRAELQPAYELQVDTLR